MKAKKFIMVLCFLSILTMMTSSAMAYTVLPYRWLDHVFRYKVDSSASDLTSLISSAATSWNNTTPVNIASLSTGEITIKKVNDSSLEWSGRTDHTVDGTPGNYYYSGALVRINQYYIGSYTSTQKQSVIAHELGHVIALGDDNGYMLYGDPKVLMIGYDTQRNSLGIYTPQSVVKYVPGIGYVYGDVQGADVLY